MKRGDNVGFPSVATTIDGFGVADYKVRIVYGAIFSPGFTGAIIPIGFHDNDDPIYTIDVPDDGIIEIEIYTRTEDYFVDPANLPIIQYKATNTADSEFVGHAVIGQVFKNITKKRVDNTQNFTGPIGYMNALGEHVIY